MTKPGSPSGGASIAVVGGGIIGLSTAWRLAQSGWQVTTFDQSAMGREASWAGAGMLSLGGEFDFPSPLAVLAAASRGLYSSYLHQLHDASGLEVDYQECGGLDLAYTPEELEALNERAARQTHLGITSKAITPAHIAQFWPRVQSAGLAGGRFYPGDAIVNPRDIVTALIVACQKVGVALRPNFPVTGAELSGESIIIHSPPALERFDAVLIAAGAWSSKIEVSGVPHLPPVEPVKGHLIGYAQPAQTCSTILRHGHTYLLQRANGLLIAGASVEHAGFDRTVRPESVAALAERAAFLLPHLAETSHSEAWVGFRPGSESPRLGSWFSQRFYLAYGHYRNGILLAPATADRLVSEINANLRTR